MLSKKLFKSRHTVIFHAFETVETGDERITNIFFTISLFSSKLPTAGASEVTSIFI